MAYANVRVRNTGSRAGSRVALVYASVPESGHERPLRRLVGFGRTTAIPGETELLTIDLDERATDVRVNGGWVREIGVTYEVEMTGV